MATSAILIEELTGKKRRLELRGGGLPFRPASYGGEMTLPTQFYPGNRNATQQVLAPKESPSDWAGMWRTYLLMRNPAQWTSQENASPVAVGFAFSLVEILDSIRMEGQLLRVTWTNVSNEPSGTAKNALAQRSWKVVRVGRIGSFNFDPDNLDDIGWKITFVWIGRDATPATVTENFGIGNIVSALQAAINAGNGIGSWPKALNNFPTHFTLGALEQMTQAPLAMVNSFARAGTSLVSRLGDVGNIILKTRDIPASIIGRCLDLANDAVSTSNNFLDQISRQSSESLANRSKVTTLTRAVSYYSGAMNTAQVMAEASASLARTSAKRRNAQGFDRASGNRVETSDLIDVIMPKKSDTWLSLAQRYYQADLSSELAKANGQSAYSIRPAPMMIIIPTRSVLASLSQRSA